MADERAIHVVVVKVEPREPEVDPGEGSRAAGARTASNPREGVLEPQIALFREVGRRRSTVAAHGRNLHRRHRQ